MQRIIFNNTFFRHFYACIHMEHPHKQTRWEEITSNTLQDPNRAMEMDRWRDGNRQSEVTHIYLHMLSRWRISQCETK